MRAAFLFSLSAFYIVASQKACVGTGPCAISCQSGECTDQTIDCGSASSCDVVCGGSSCVRANFTWDATPSSTSATYSIRCAGGSACENAVINWPEWGPKAAGLTCESQASCRGMSSIEAPEGSAFDFNCNQGHACGGVTIRCPTNEHCDIHCLGSNSCRNNIMWCPVAPNRCFTECGGDFSCDGTQFFYLTLTPTQDPTMSTLLPTGSPTFLPTFLPTSTPTFLPTSTPTFLPTGSPSLLPTRDPTVEPTMAAPTTAGGDKGSSIADCVRTVQTSKYGGDGGNVGQTATRRAPEGEIIGIASWGFNAIFDGIANFSFVTADGDVSAPLGYGSVDTQCEPFQLAPGQHINGYRVIYSNDLDISSWAKALVFYSSNGASFQCSSPALDFSNNSFVDTGIVQFSADSYLSAVYLLPFGILNMIGFEFVAVDNENCIQDSVLLPPGGQAFLSDPYGRFEAKIQFDFNIEQAVSEITPTCNSCFVWQLRNIGQSTNWTNIVFGNGSNVVVTTQYALHENGGETYLVSLTVQSVRTAHAGYCVDDAIASDYMFEPGREYEVRLRVLAQTTQAEVFVSDTINVATNWLPTNGSCEIENIATLIPLLQPFTLRCTDWLHADQNALAYNALMDDVLVGMQFASAATALSAVTPAGGVLVVALIQDALQPQAISCYPIHAQFRSVVEVINSSAVTADSILNEIQTIINSTSLADALDTAVAITTVVNELSDNQLIPDVETQTIIYDVVHNIVTASTEVRNVTTKEQITNQVSSIASIITNPQHNSEETVSLLTNQYIPDLLTTQPESSLSWSASELFTTVTLAHHMIDRLDDTLSVQNYQDNSLSESLIDASLRLSSHALARSNVGETFNYISNSQDKLVSATKFSAGVTILDNVNNQSVSCGAGEQSITIPQPFMAEHNGTFDCVFMAATVNNLIPAATNAGGPSLRASATVVQARTQLSANLISANLYDDNQTLIVYESHMCFPYLMEISLDAEESVALWGNDSVFDWDRFELEEETEFVSCDWWNIGSSLWGTSGCFVVAVREQSVLCGCTHLTTFSVSEKNFVPESNILAATHIRQLTLDNIMKYPMVAMTIGAVLIVFLALCVINPRSKSVSTKSILAFEDVVYKSVKDEILWKDIAGKEIKCLSRMPNQDQVGFGLRKVAKDETEKVCELSMLLFLIYVRNDHTLLSLFGRTSGTNYSVKQRLGCFFLYLSTIMVSTGYFYGAEQSTLFQDIVASFLISLSSTLPVTTFRKLFEKSRPRDTPSTRENTGAANPASETLDTITKRNSIDEHNIGKLTRTATRFGTFKSTLLDIHKNDDEMKIAVFHDVRLSLLHSMYPLPHCCRYIAWILLILWCVAACVVAVSWGLRFDINFYDRSANANNRNVAFGAYNEPCWNFSLSLRLEDALSERQLRAQDEELEAMNAASYGGSDSKSWLMSIGQSLLTSLLLWQPLSVYLVTWLKLWMFTWNLKMKVGPGNIFLLCKRCCCGYNKESIKKLRHQISSALGLEERVAHANPEHSRSNSSIASHDNRPLDIISFLAYDMFVIDDTVGLEMEGEGEGNEGARHGTAAFAAIEEDIVQGGEVELAMAERKKKTAKAPSANNSMAERKKKSRAKVGYGREKEKNSEVELAIAGAPATITPSKNKKEKKSSGATSSTGRAKQKIAKKSWFKKKNVKKEATTFTSASAIIVSAAKTESNANDSDKETAAGEAKTGAKRKSSKSGRTKSKSSKYAE